MDGLKWLTLKRPNERLSLCMTQYSVGDGFVQWHSLKRLPTLAPRLSWPTQRVTLVVNKKLLDYERFKALQTEPRLLMPSGCPEHH